MGLGEACRCWFGDVGANMLGKSSAHGQVEDVEQAGFWKQAEGCTVATAPVLV